MTAQGEPVENRNDPEDWQIGPLFQGLIEVDTPAFPNPVNLNTLLKIEIDVKGFDSINGYEIFVFSNPDEIGSALKTSTESTLPPGISTIILDPNQFPEVSGAQSAPLFRILIYDKRQNLITYGDVEII